MNHLPAALELDAAGGALLVDFDGTGLTVDDPELRCLDVPDAPALEYIDLSALPRSVTLTVRGCPRLRAIRLPRAAGNVVHVDFGSAPENLSIEGPLQEADGCWAWGEFRFTLPRQARPLGGCFVGRPVPAAVPEGLVLVAPPDAALALDDCGVRHLAVVGAPALKRLVLGRLDGALVQDCPQLRDLRTQSVDRLRLTDCPAVAEIGGGGRSLGVRRGSAAGLSVTGPWARLALSECNTRSLHAPEVAHVSLRALPALETLRLAGDARVQVSGPVWVQCMTPAGVELDEPAVTSLAGRAARGDADALDVLSAWCDRARTPRARLYALRGLAAALGEAGNPAVLWRLRCRVNIDPRGGQALDDATATERALSGWHWELPRDLAQEGWDADLALWLACRHLPEAARFTRVLARCRQPLQIATLARAAGNCAVTADAREQLAALLLKALRRSPPPFRPKEPRAHLAQAEHVLYAVLATGRRALAEAFADYVMRGNNALYCVPLLRQLASLGVTRARLHLMSLARSAPGHVREQAMAAALAPVRARLFADSEFTV